MPQTHDLSVIVTAHDETLVCGPTMAAADVAIACAQDAGISVERIIALDNATAATTQWFHQPRFDHWTRMTFTEGDLGRVRNAVLPASTGRYIAFLDADDLFSRTWLREGVARLRAAERTGPGGGRTIAHPELNWLFDGAHGVYSKPEQHDALFSPYHFYSTNYYDSLCMAPREAHLAHPYIHRDIPAGLSFQDWQFAIETMADGWTHVTARDTIIFKRRRDTSLVNESRARRAIVRQTEAMAVDRVDDLAGGGATLREPDPAPPSVPDDAPSHIGAAFDARVVRARALRGNVRAGDADAYDAVRARFDHRYYLAVNPDIRALENVDPVAHYMRTALSEARDPAPWFDTRAYLDRHPKLRETRVNPFYHWITTHEDTGETPPPVADFDTLADSFGLSQADTFAMWRARYDDTRARLEYGALGAEVADAAQIEPLIERGWQAALEVRIPPFHRAQITSRTAAMWRLVQACGKTRARYVICVNRARFGAAPRVEGQIARALAALGDAGDVLVITTDRTGDMPEGKLPNGVRVVDFAGLAPELRGDMRARVLTEFLRALHPDAVFNVNSRLLWDAMGPYGTALGTSMRLYACLLCNERDATGHWTGYPLRRFYRHFDQLSGVFTDSDFLTDQLRDRHALTGAQAARVVTLPNPVDASIPVAERVAEREPETTPDAFIGPVQPARPQIFWAGRLDAQKRIDLVFDIARAMPDVDLRAWGDAVMTGAAPLPPTPANLHLEGAYATFTDLPLNRADLWLYTAAWDGVPTMLLEVAMTGIPIVGSDVGGTREVLQDGLATALPASATVQDWVAAIRATLGDTSARERALTLRDTLIKTRTRGAHERALYAMMELPA